MLQTRTEETQAKVKAVLDKEGTSYWFPDHKEGVHIDDYISYDEMAAIVDAIRGDERKRRAKTSQLGIHSNIDKLWVTDDTIWLRGCKPSEATAFIQSLGAFGCDVYELMEEYKQKGGITL